MSSVRNSNSHFSGSTLWDLFMSASYNVSFRIMFDLPHETHKYLIEPVSGKAHLKKVFVKRFLKFTDSLKTTKKIALKNFFNYIKNDCQSVTGANLQRISKLLNKTSIENLVPDDAFSICYESIPEYEEWRVKMINEITYTKFGISQISGFSHEEIGDMLRFVCIF